MDRTAQRNDFESAVQAFYAAQDASDSAADKAGATRNARMAADKADARARQTGPASKAEAADAADLQVQAQDTADTAAAQTAWNASQTAFATLENALGNLNTNPGAVEQA